MMSQLLSVKSSVAAEGCDRFRGSGQFVPLQVFDNRSIDFIQPGHCWEKRQITPNVDSSDVVIVYT